MKIGRYYGIWKLKRLIYNKSSSLHTRVPLQRRRHYHKKNNINNKYHINIYFFLWKILWDFIKHSSKSLFSFNVASLIQDYSLYYKYSFRILLTSSQKIGSSWNEIFEICVRSVPHRSDCLAPSLWDNQIWWDWQDLGRAEALKQVIEIHRERWLKHNRRMPEDH